MDFDRRRYVFPHGDSSKIDVSSDQENVTQENKHSSRFFDETDYVPESYKVTKYDIIWLVISIGSHIFDVGFDIYVAVSYYLHSQLRNFTWTLVFIIVPSLVTTLVSMRWYIMDYRNNPKKSPMRTLLMRCLALILQLAPTLRYIESLVFALKSRKYRKEKNKEKEREFCYLMLKEDADAALLRVIECFLESAPQLVLQLSILMYKSHSEMSLHEISQWMSSAMSFVSLAWALASYQRSLRYPQEDKGNITYRGMVLQFLWHLMIILSRVISLSCLATVFPLWIIVACAAHIMFYHIYLLLKGPKGACGDSVIWQNALCLILATIYIFTGIQVRDGPTRWFYGLLYSIFILENAALVTVWFCMVSSGVSYWLLWAVPLASLGCFILGICFMLLYYKFFHPSRFSRNNVI